MTQGTTLVEALVAAGLLAVVLLAAAGLLVGANRQVASSDHLTRALMLAESSLARAIVGERRPLLNRLGCHLDAVDCRVSGDALELRDTGLPRAELLLQLTAIDGASLAETLVMRITVRVRWIEGARRRAVRLTTART
jgi:hypothetical protein